jgi:CRP-like cAMP-binding protein
VSPQVPLLTALTAQQRLALCTAFTAVSVPAGSAVIRKGEEGDTFYVLEEGNCTVVGDDGQVSRIASVCESV